MNNKNFSRALTVGSELLKRKETSCNGFLLARCFISWTDREISDEPELTGDVKTSCMWMIDLLWVRGWLTRRQRISGSLEPVGRLRASSSNHNLIIITGSRVFICFLSSFHASFVFVSHQSIYWLIRRSDSLPLRLDQKTHSMLKFLSGRVMDCSRNWRIARRSLWSITGEFSRRQLLWDHQPRRANVPVCRTTTMM